MKKKGYFGSNFKMYKNAAATEEYLKAITAATADISREDYQFFFIPSYTALERASESPVRSEFMLGAQNMCWESEGQFTGEISPEMLKEFGVELALIGHSERRHTFGETDATENKKVLKALEYGFTVLLAIGETSEEKDFGICPEVKLWIAYEPVWSIGVSGTPATPEYAQEVHHEIRKCLVELFGEAGNEVPLLYGGSVNPENGTALLTQPDINGLFTTRTAFQVEKFAALIKEGIAATAG